MSDKRSVKRARAITMRDVARHAQVSQSTVSRVLNPSKEQTIPIGEETRQRVLDAVKKLGYVPNLHAGSLRGQKTKLLAVLIADIANPHYHAIVRSVQDYAHEQRYDVLIANSDHRRENELLFCESMIRRPVDGIVAVPYHLTQDEMGDLSERTGAAIAVLARHIKHPSIDTVVFNDGDGVYEAVRWLAMERGYERIGFIGVTNRFHAGNRRQKAYERALASVGQQLRPEYVMQSGDWSVESGQRAAEVLLSLPEPPTAIFACNDFMAIGAMQAAEAKGINIPEQLAIVGFDNIPAASWVRPRLTTVLQPSAEIGHQLVQAVFQRIQGDAAKTERLHGAPCRLIIRESA